MQLISHRRNSIKQLEATDSKYGVEVDIRTFKGDLISRPPKCTHLM